MSATVYGAVVGGLRRSLGESTIRLIVVMLPSWVLMLPGRLGASPLARLRELLRWAGMTTDVVGPIALWIQERADILLPVSAVLVVVALACAGSEQSSEEKVLLVLSSAAIILWEASRSFVYLALLGVGTIFVVVALDRYSDTSGHAQRIARTLVLPLVGVLAVLFGERTDNPEVRVRLLGPVKLHHDDGPTGAKRVNTFRAS